MCDALHAMTCLNQCDVMSLLEVFLVGVVIVLCVMIVWGISSDTHCQLNQTLSGFMIYKVMHWAYVCFNEPWIVQDSGKGICKDLWWFLKPSIPWLFQPFWRTTQVYYPTITLGGSIPVYWIAHLSHTCARWVENGHMHRNIKIPGIQD